MRKTYDTIEAYREDYRFAWPPVNEPLPSATVTITGARVEPVPMWSRPEVGGHLVFQGNLPFTMGVGQCPPWGTPHPSRIVAKDATGFTLEVAPNYQGTFLLPTPSASDTLASYHVPRFMLDGSNPAIMRRVWGPPILKLIETLKGFSTPLLAGDQVLIVGSGFAWEAEIWNREGYQAIGVDTSPFVHANKTVSYESEYRTILLAAGLDPDQGEGAALLAQWMQDDRTAAIVLDEDINTGQGKKAVRDAFGLTGNAKVKWAYTSFVLPVLDDNEAVALNTGMLGIADNVFHYTSVGQNPDGSGASNQRTDFNWKSPVQWKALLSPAMIISSGFEVM